MAPALRLDPIEEREWADPAVLMGLPGGNLNSESVLWYFMNSPFYDPSSNNTVVMNEGQRFPERAHVLQSRKAFEDAVKSLGTGGLQFLVTAEPTELGQPWVVQKQMRHVGQGANGEDKIEVLGTYYTGAGDRWLMAPSLLNVLQDRMLAISYYLQEFHATAQSLTYFTPSTGYSFFPPNYEPPKAGPGSRAGSVEPDLGPQPDIAAPSAADGNAEYTAADDDMLMETLGLVNKYGHEYMDENPLHGEPGSFVFESTHQQVDARNKAQAPTASQTTSKAEPTDSFVSTAAPTPTPRPVGSQEPATTSRKPSLTKLPSTKKERRKSKAGINTPISPTAPPH